MSKDTRNPTTRQETPSPRLACVAVGGLPFVHPPGHPLAGDVVEFRLWIPGSYEMMISAKDDPSRWTRFYVDVDEDGRARVRIVEGSFPDGYRLTELERELLDGLAGIIARDVLRRRRGIA